MSYADDVQRFADVLGSEQASVPSYVIEGVLRDSNHLHHLAERACSDPTFTPADEAHQEHVEARIARNLEPFGIACEFGHDPRGAVVKLRLTSGRHNDFGGEDYYVVPTPQE